MATAASAARLRALTGRRGHRVLPAATAGRLQRRRRRGGQRLMPLGPAAAVLHGPAAAATARGGAHLRVRRADVEHLVELAAQPRHVEREQALRLVHRSCRVRPRGVLAGL